MADTKITALTALTAADPANDVIPIVDVSDTSMAASGTTKKISVNNILGASGTATLASATITGDLTVDTSTLKVDSTNNRVGIGTASPGYPLHVSATDAEIVIQDSNTAVGSNPASLLSFWGSASRAGYIGYPSDNNLYITQVANSSILFLTNNTEALRLNTTGNLVLKGGTAAANGVGVTFPATQVASSDANCLDDYEEGTFTPHISGTATYTAQAGVYTKVGRLVTASFDITILLRGTGEIATVSGLPFAASANVGAAVAVSYFGGLATSAASIYGYVNSSTMVFITIAAGGGTSPSGAVVITNGTRLAGTAVYMV